MDGAAPSPAPSPALVADAGGSPPWWRSAVVYQIYPRSFRDASGDGVGDLAGAIAGLDHVSSLGVDAVWLSPFYSSPQADGGYDISDFRAVDPLFGTLDDFDALVEAAHARSLRVIVDLVPNHVSSAHPWFAEALAGEPDGGERSRFIFRRGRGAHGELPPNNWQSLFSGPAWTQVSGAAGEPGQWYLHLFDSSQPDLNWNNPQVRAEFDDILRFWLDRGVDGFRVDVARGLVKADGLPDYPEAYQVAPAGAPDGTRSPMFDQPGVHEIYRRWRQTLDAYPGERILVAEAHVQPQSRLAHYVRSDEMHQAFNFEYLQTPYSAPEIRAVIDRSLAACGQVGAPATWVLNDHDDTRHRTRFAMTAHCLDLEVGLRRARLATAVMLALPGSAYIYQGEELGLPEVTDLAPADRRDPTFARSGGTSLGRDGCRVPLPWVRGGPAFGFSSTGLSWLPQPAAWGNLSVEAQQDDPASTLALYRIMLSARRAHGLGTAEIGWNSGPPDDVLDFTVGPVRVIANLGPASVVLPAGEVLVSTNDSLDRGVLPPDSAVWLLNL